MPERALFTPLCTELLTTGHAVRFTATGSSMHPAIRNGETVVVKPVEPAGVRRGDVVLYDSSRGLTAHRVVGTVRGGNNAVLFLMRGDGHGALEERVDSGDVLGRVVRVERGPRGLDPGSLRSRLIFCAWRAIVALKKRTLGWVAGSRLPLPQTARWQRSASQGGST